MSTPIRVLIVDDQAADAELMLHELHLAGFDSDWQRVETEPDFLAGLETNPDLILVDWSLPQFSGLRVLQLLNECGRGIPFIIVSGVIGEEVAVDAMRLGAADYVMKDRLARLGQAVCHVLEDKQLRTERSLAEEQLRFQANLLVNVSDAIVATDSQHRITAWNAAAEALYGWKAQEVLGRDGLEITHTEWPEVEAEVMRRTIAETKHWRGEATQIRRDGTRFPVEVSTLVLHGENGQINGYVSVNHDITERKQAEDLLRESEGKYRTLFEGSSQGILATDIETNRFIDANPSICRMFGYSKEELLRLGIMEIHPQVAQDEIKSGIEDQRQKGRSLSTEVPCLRKDGTIFYADISGATTVIHGRRCVVGFFVDVTERKRAGQALKDSEQRFRDIAENAQEWIWEIDEQGKYTYASQMVEKILGYTPQEILQKYFYDLFHPEDREALKAAAMAAFAAKQPFREFINRNMHKNGQTIWLSTSALPLLDDKGNLLGYRGADTNITERKQAEEALRASEEQLHLVTDNMLDMVIQTDLQGTFLYVSPSHKIVLGYEPANLLGMSVYDYMHPEDIDRVRNVAFSNLQAEMPGRQEYRYRHADGHYIWLESIGTPIYDDNGSPIGAVFSTRDITERKQAESALRESERKYRTLVENIPQKIFTKDRELKYLSSNENYARDLGIRPADIVGKTDYDFYPKDLAEKYRSDDKIIMETAQLKEFEEKYLYEGRDKWIHTIKTPVRDENGEIVALFGIFWDITERKQAEQALQDSEQKYHLLVDNASEVIAVVQEGNLKFVNRMASDLTGYSEQELTSRPFSELIHPDDRGMGMEYYLRRINGDLNIPRYAFRLIARDGIIKWVEVSAVLIEWGGKPATLNFLTDITERKQGELVREALYTISQAAVTKNLEDFYLSIHHAIGNLMPVDNFYIALYDPDADLLSFPFSVDQHDASYPPQKPGRGLTEYVLRTGHSLLVDRQAFIPLVQQSEVELVGSDSVEWLGVPLRAGEKIFGVIAVQSYTESVRFSHADMEVLEFVSDQVTTVIDRKLIQQRIADALELNLTVINASTLGISAYDSSGQCILANEAIASILGATRSQILQQNYKHIETWKKSGLLKVAREAAARGKETRREIHTKSEFGKEIWLNCHFTPFASNGEPHILRIIEDISNAKQDEIALQAYATKLEQSNRDLQEFAYVASHDLQEPLRKVLAFSDLIVNEYGDALDETGRDYMKRMDSACQRMMTLITDLLSFARVETRSQPFTEVDLNTVAQDVVSDLENQIESTQGRIEICKLPMIEADPTQMHQLLQNLISNALKFHHEGNSPLVKISAKIDGDACQISVEDNGIGFDIQYLDRIFKPFERLHSREEYVGSGMGLAICRRIVERHRGKITATTTPGEGSTFIVTIPIHQSKGDRPHV